MTDFSYEPLLQLGPDDTEYELVAKDHVSLREVGGKEVLQVEPEALTLLARRAFTDLAHLLRTSHLESLARILDDPEASANDRAVAHELLRNAAIAAQGVLPGCQDTGTATVVAKKGQYVWTEGDDAEALSRGVFRAYTEGNLRYSQLAPLSMFEEKNTGSNLPAQIDIYAGPGRKYEFLFLAKGGGSANKMFLYQETKALLNEESLLRWADAAIRKLGTAACPPYHLAIVVGGTSAETTLKILKLATAHDLDTLPETGSPGGRAFRDRGWEERILRLAQESGIGAQFGGKYFCHDVRVVRLPRHGASCPVGVGVSCSADRNVKARIDKDGIWIEKLERHPERFLLAAHEAASEPPVAVDIDRPMREVLAQLTRYPVATRLSLSGEMVVARDIAHARLKERLDRGEGLPEYFKEKIVYYAGPAKTPPGMPSGSFGPTTAQRMDPYVPVFQAAGGSLISLAKGNRGREVVEACRRYGGFYLGSIGGPAARLAHDCIKSVEVLEYPELGMEAIWKIRVEDFPAFIVIDDKGNDFYAPLLQPRGTPLPTA
ncbi:MAG: fumarate hydratase [Planctomycetota bacterium]|nr:MAG: fumarate hydratase [Planctomycetota bacterium]